MEQNYSCKFCNVRFHKESTLATHLCVKKRRFMDIESTGSRLGFMAFRKFYDLTTNSKKDKTIEEFINSPYYSDFVKFGHHLANLKPMHMEEFIEFAIRSGLKIKEWHRDEVFYYYIENFIKKEPPTSAVERSIIEIVGWCEKNACEFTQFFNTITANEFVHMLKMGKISPWILYLSSTGTVALAKFNEEHAEIIKDIIDPSFWVKKFKKQTEDVDHIREILGQSGI